MQRFYPDDPRILPVYERLLARGAVLLIHVGSAPWPNEFDGFPRFERVMDMFPELKVIVAHMGQFETRRHLELMERCPNLYLDTTMAMAPQSPIYRGAARREPGRRHRRRSRALAGSHPLRERLPEPARTPTRRSGGRSGSGALPEAVYRKIFHDNARRLLGL